MIEVLETIVSVVKHLAVGAGSGLAGLQSMHAAGEFLGGWPAGALPAGTQYYALASDFEPAGGALVSLRDRVTDAVFGDAGNDLSSRRQASTRLGAAASHHGASRVRT